MDTTRGIARSYDKLSALTRFHAHQFQQPSRPTDAGHRKLFGRQDADAPARRRRRRLPQVRSLHLPPPSANRQCHRPGFLRRELQSPRRHHRQPDELADDGAKATIRKTLFHCCQDIFLLVSLCKDDTVWMKTSLGECGEKQIRTRQAPENLTLGTCSNAGNAKGRRRTIDGSRAAAGELVQRAMSQSPSRQRRIDFGHPEGKTAGLFRRAAFQRSDAVAKVGDHPFAGSNHRSRILSGSRWRADFMSIKCRCSLSVPKTKKSQVVATQEYFLVILAMRQIRVTNH
jgi:hypothetical protein